ncbi:MAG: acetoin dehydrogenase dihydrolipoyllysine-residue acetyltransferase subunit [Pseudomonadota bacterium]|nr:acetoin dehydrogenase dihydrolipoyllysine-residue acetyltransferase subunit [Pseudomonadota bacterium]MEE3099742.1 acetoin dehydrogenase dihydrolipoyllysine-residue acetyltransferase subunit [Pseudomonadota bacterium]
MAEIKVLRMPKWGLAMEEGVVVEWLKAVGEDVVEGEEIVEIETTKITNVLEATQSGRLARIVAAEGETLPVGAVIAVLTDGEVPEVEIDAFLADRPAVAEMADEEDEDAAPARSDVQVGPRRIGAATAGTGAPIVLLHGFSGDLDNWMFLMGDLRSAGQVIAIDLPGHGGSSKDVGDGSLATLAAAVAGALDALGVVEPAVVAGHSLGGAVAMRLALDHPEKVSALRLVSPAGLPGDAVSRDFLDAIVEAQRPRDVKAALERLFADPSAVRRDMVDGVMRALRLDGAREALALLRDRMIAGEDFAAIAARLDELPPTSVVVGGRDAIVGRPDRSRLPPSWRFHEIEAAGHMPHLEAAPDVAAVIRAARAG